LVQNLNIQFFKAFKRKCKGNKTFSEFGPLSALSEKISPKIQPLTIFIQLILIYEAELSADWQHRLGKKRIGLCGEKSGERGRKHGRMNYEDNKSYMSAFL
jgi:hypothetical protein